MEQEVYASAFHATAKDPAEAEQKLVRARIMMRVEEVIEENGWSRAEAARRCGVSQRRIVLLQRHRFHEFTLEDLLKLAGALGLRVS